jgi:predicted RNase H-like HicB family nuclease
MSTTQDIEYTVQIWKEGNQFIAHAMPLDVMSSGKTPEDARRALDEAVHLFLITAVDMGTLEEVLQDAGQIPPGFPPGN